MDGRYRAVIVGVNECPQDPSIRSLKYAEDDARAIHALLTDPMSGTIDMDDAMLLLGADATTHRVKRALRRAALATQTPDVLLFYFSGHGLIPLWSTTGEAYLSTYDTSETELQNDPDEGIRTGFLRRDIFEEARGTSLLILDCCHAGDYTVRMERQDPRAFRSRTLEQAFYDSYPQAPGRHSALLSCPRNATARESDEYHHGWFTYEILRGLHGEAIGTNGDVNLDSLAGYLGNSGGNPPVGRLIQAWGGSVLLTRPALADISRDEEASDSRKQVPLQFMPLAHPMDVSVPQLWNLLNGLFMSGSDITGPHSDSDQCRLDRVCLATQSAGAMLVDCVDQVRPIQWTDPHIAHDAAPAVQQLISRMDARDRHALGYVTTNDGPGSIMVIDLPRPRRPGKALVLIQPPTGLAAIGEPLAILLSEFQAPEPELAATEANIEFGVLSALRERFGRLPYRLHERAFELYALIMNSLTVVFEPVVELNKDADLVGIVSWEALARESPEKNSAPGRLLDLASRWGTRFVVERDSILASRAIRDYRAAHIASHAREIPKPVSINVSVASILSDDYIKTLRSAIDDAYLGPQKVTLEISEKDAIEPPTGQIWLPNPMQFFLDRLTRIASSLRVHFAVDDFGVGHASLDRLATLTLTQIKIDPAILRHPRGLDELELVTKVANEVFHRGGAPISRAIVVEGVDRDCPIPLSDIYAAGIQFVQGYIVEQAASADLRPLTEETCQLIAGLVRGETGMHDPAPSTSLA